MRIIICTVAFCLIAMTIYAENPSYTFEGPDSCELYDAMDAEEVLISATEHFPAYYSKALPGLKCIFWEEGSSGYKYGCSCTFDENLSWFQREMIYKGLNSEEQYAQDFDQEIFTKTIGGLYFQKVTFVKFDREQRDYYFSVFEEQHGSEQ